MAKREQGHRIQVTFFVPVNPDDLENTIATSTAVDKAERGDFSGITSAAVLSFKRRYTSRAPDDQPETVNAAGQQVVPSEDGTGYEPAPPPDGDDDTPAVIRRATRGAAS